jgi:dipeptidyl aminopeptidase/acylaminoacyl peptidase
VYRAGTSFKDDRRIQLFVFDLEKKEAKRWTDSEETDYILGGLTPDNKHIIAARKKPGEPDESLEHEIVKINAEKETAVICDVYSGYPRIELSEDGKYIVTTPQKPEKNSLGFNYIELIAMKDSSKKQLAEKVDANKMLLKWSKDSQKIFFQVMDKGTCGIWQVDVSTGEAQKVVGGDKVIVGYDISDDNKWLTYQAFHVNDPSKLYLYDLEKKEEKLIDEPNAEFLAKRKIGSTETIWYDGYDNDFKIQGWILTPPEFDPKKKYPLAVNMHGGPHVMWSNHQSIPMFHEFQLLAAQGSSCNGHSISINIPSINNKINT